LTLPGVEGNGVYVYNFEEKRWRLLRVDGEPFRVGELGPGFYIVYFDNLECSACKLQDEELMKAFSEFEKSLLEKLKPVAVVCDWFARRCRSEAAAKTYKLYDVHMSPTILVCRVDEGGEYCERLVGVKFARELYYYLHRIARRSRA